MSQHDMNVGNAQFGALRTDTNNALAALVSQNSGATEPATMYAYMLWADTTSGLLKIRNAANTAWVTVGTLASANLGLALLTGSTAQDFSTQNLTVNGRQNLKVGANIASAATLDLSTATGNLVQITGTTATSAVTMTPGQWMRCIANNVWPLTYHATTNRISGGADYICASNDVIDYFYDGTTVYGHITKADGSSVGKKPAFLAFSAATSCGASVHQKLTFNNEQLDTNNNFDATTNYRFTPTVAGWYQINLAVFMNLAATARLAAEIYKNGSLYLAGYTTGNAVGANSCVSAFVYFNGSTDYIEAYGFQDSAGAVSTNASGSLTQFSGALVITG